MRPRSGLLMRVLLLCFAGAATVASITEVFVHGGMPKAYVPLLAAYGALIVGLCFPSAVCCSLSAGTAAAALGLALSGWGLALSPEATAHALKDRHSNFLRPIHCRRDWRNGPLFGALYECADRLMKQEPMGVQVDDREIVEEYP